ncbi:MAG: hypothetical protein K2J90_07195 [Lachnospiraceae bacterium]|nr:hypothetical protein [Lachnospiraceae bacterium]
MKHNLTIYKDISRLITVTLVYLLGFITVLTIYEKQITNPRYLLGIPAILLGYLIIQRYCYQPILYILLHGIFYVPILLISFPNKWYTGLYIIMLILENIHAIHIWIHNTDQPYTEVPWYLFFFVAVLYIAALGFQQVQLADYVYYIGILLLMLHFIRYFIYGVSCLFSQSEHTTTMPTKKIMLTNSVLFGFLLLAFLLLAFFARIFELDQLLYVIGDFLIKLFQTVIRLILYLAAVLRLLFSSDNSTDDTAKEKEELSQAIQKLPPEPSLFAKILTTVIELAVIIFIIYLLYRIISYFISLLLTRYASDSDIIVPCIQKKETVKKKKNNASALSKLKEYFDTGYAAKIRHAYRIKINSYKDSVYEKNDAPKDIAQKVLKVYDEDISELTEVYEKARYSNEEITYEDVQKGGIL